MIQVPYYAPTSTPQPSCCFTYKRWARLQKKPKTQVSAFVWLAQTSMQMSVGFSSSIIALTQTILTIKEKNKQTEKNLAKITSCFFRQKGKTFTPIETTSSTYSLAFIMLSGPSKSFQILYYFHAIIPCAYHPHQLSRHPFIIMRIQTFNISKHIPAFPYKLNPMKSKGGWEIQSKG